MITGELELPSKGGYAIPCREFLPKGDVRIAVIGVHGFGGDSCSSVLDALGRELCARGGALICPDLPAHGKSRAEDSLLRVEACKNDLLTVADHVKKRFPKSRYGIFATSFGGYISLLCAPQLSDFITVLRAPAVTMAETFVKVIMGISHEEFARTGSAVCGFERKMKVPYDFYKDLLENPVSIPHTPLLIIHGTEDDVVPYSAVEEMVRDRDNVTLAALSGADHRFKRPGDLEFILKKSLARFVQ
ncbi:MAG: alpha/beta fold hydrolase [Clostridia bacterium]|nr:alpha/beta fold hydrolase [Clostridia bacterium]